MNHLFSAVDRKHGKVLSEATGTETTALLKKAPSELISRASAAIDILPAGAYDRDMTLAELSEYGVSVLEPSAGWMAK